MQIGRRALQSARAALDLQRLQLGRITEYGALILLVLLGGFHVAAAVKHRPGCRIILIADVCGAVYLLRIGRLVPHAIRGHNGEVLLAGILHRIRRTRQLVSKYPSGIGKRDTQRRGVVGNDGIKIRIPEGALCRIEIADIHVEGAAAGDGIDFGETDAETAVDVLECQSRRTFHGQNTGAIIAVPVGKILRFGRGGGDVNPRVIGIRVTGSRHRCNGRIG